MSRLRSSIRQNSSKVGDILRPLAFFLDGIPTNCWKRDPCRLDLTRPVNKDVGDKRPAWLFAIRVNGLNNAGYRRQSFVTRHLAIHVPVYTERSSWLHRDEPGTASFNGLVVVTAGSSNGVGCRHLPRI